VILDGDGPASISLVSASYEFPPESDSPEWLVIHGHVSTLDGSWNLQAAIMTTGESMALGEWLLSVAAEEIPAAAGDDPTFTFLEPSLAFSVASYGPTTRLRVYLSHDCAAPWLDIDDQLRLYAYFLELTLSPAAIEASARSWIEEIQAFPTR